MRQSALCIFILLSIFVPKGYSIIGDYGILSSGLKGQGIVQEQVLTPMQALDFVKEQYAANFDKVLQDTGEEHYYKLSIADYYLVYEGNGATDKDYLFHLYEFVVDEVDTGIGHTVTYGWYTVNKETGEISDQTQE